MGEKVCIVGSGLIGRCWAMMFARAGYEVNLYDIAQKQIDDALESVKSQLEGLMASGLLNGQTADEVAARVSGQSDLAAALKGAVHCQECCPESIPMKKKVFAGLDEHADDNIVLASSSSCIAASEFSGDLKHKAQVIVAHPVNPPHYIPLVEIIPSPDTSPEVVERTSKLMKALGQSPVTLKKEVNGFILNRLQYALLMESWRIVEEGVCSPEDVDTAVKEGLGLRWSFMGPFETIDLNAPGGVSDYCERYGENITAVCAEQDKLGARAMKGAPAAQEIHDAMRKTVPTDSMDARRKWRDDRLAALYLHKREQAQKDKDAKHPWA
eukprot:m.340044 g.340044  ORF g.340044 m.340044 type:complete len:326 (-) comp19100_c0_seq1:216-1193(-)